MKVSCEHTDLPRVTTTHSVAALSCLRHPRLRSHTRSFIDDAVGAGRRAKHPVSRVQRAQPARTSPRADNCIALFVHRPHGDRKRAARLLDDVTRVDPSRNVYGRSRRPDLPGPLRAAAVPQMSCCPSGVACPRAVGRPVTVLSPFRSTPCSRTSPQAVGPVRAPGVGLARSGRDGAGGGRQDLRAAAWTSGVCRLTSRGRGMAENLRPQGNSPQASRWRRSSTDGPTPPTIRGWDSGSVSCLRSGAFWPWTTCFGRE